MSDFKMPILVRRRGGTKRKAASNVVGTSTARPASHSVARCLSIMAASSECSTPRPIAG